MDRQPQEAIADDPDGLPELGVVMAAGLVDDQVGQIHLQMGAQGVGGDDVDTAQLLQDLVRSIVPRAASGIENHVDRCMEAERPAEAAQAAAKGGQHEAVSVFDRRRLGQHDHDAPVGDRE